MDEQETNLLNGLEEKQIEIINRISSDTIREEVFNDLPYLVVPMTMAKTIVMNELLYTEQSFNPFQSWDGASVTVGHPSDFSANTPQNEEKLKIGTIYNTSYEKGSLKGEAWLNTIKMMELGYQPLLERLLNREVIDVSTGGLADVEMENGMYEGDSYIGRVVNIYPDHLAILPNEKGACSVTEGCGTLLVNKVIKNCGNCEGTCGNCSTKENSVVANFFKKYATQLGFEIVRNSEATENPELDSGEKEEATETTSLNNVKESDIMHKDEMVTAIISNSENSFSEADKETLSNLSEDILHKFLVNTEEKEENASEDANEAEEKPEADSEEKAEATPEAETEEEAKDEESVEEVVNNVRNSEVREFLENAVKKYREEKEELITDISNSSEFSKKDLSELSQDMLIKMKNSFVKPRDYTGARPSIQVEEKITNRYQKMDVTKLCHMPEGEE